MSKTVMASLRMRLEHRWSQRRMSHYVDGDMSSRERERLERHADVCPECGPLRRALLWLTVELRAPQHGPERSIAPQVIEYLRAAEPEHAPPRSGS